MRSLKSKVNANAPLSSKDDKIVIKMEDFEEDDDEFDHDNNINDYKCKNSVDHDINLNNKKKSALNSPSADNISCSNESGFGTVDEINSIESDNSIKEHHHHDEDNKKQQSKPIDNEVAIINVSNKPAISHNLFQQHPSTHLNENFEQLQLDSQHTVVNLSQPQSQQANRHNGEESSQHSDDDKYQTRNSTQQLYNDNLVILNNSMHSTTTFSSSFSRRIQENRFLRYLCFCCTCCKTTNTIFWSWLSIFCCCCPLLGGISLYFTHKSRKYKLKQKYDLSDKYSNYAEKLNIASLIFGVLFYAVAFFIITLVLFMYWRHSYA